MISHRKLRSTTSGDIYFKNNSFGIESWNVSKTTLISLSQSDIGWTIKPIKTMDS